MDLPAAGVDSAMAVVTLENVSTNAATNPILMAVASNDANLLDSLLSNFATPLSTASIGSTHDGKSPLHIAALLGHDPCLRLLLPTFPKLIHATDSRGNTPLHLATQLNHATSVSLLLGAGSLPFHPRNSAGHSPYDLIDSEPIRLAYRQHFASNPPLDLSPDSPARTVLCAALPTDVGQLHDLVVALAHSATGFESAARSAIRDSLYSSAASTATTTSFNDAADADVDGRASKATQLQYLLEENEHLSLTAATLRRHVRALERDLEAKDAALHNQLAQLADAHRKEISQLKQSQARHMHELQRQMSLKSLKSVVGPLDFPGGGGAGESVPPTPTMATADGSVSTDTHVDTPPAVGACTEDEHIDKLAALEAANLQLADKLRLAEQSNSQLERDLEALRRSLPTLREDLYRHMLRENEAVQAAADDRDVNQGLIVFGPAGVSGERAIKAAVPEKLVERLVVGHPVDYPFRATFLLTFREFMTPDQFLDKLEAAYMPGNSAIVLRIGDLLHDWMSRYWPDFASNNALLKRAMAFLHDRLTPDDQAAVVPRIEELVQTRLISPWDFDAAAGLPKSPATKKTRIPHLIPGGAASGGGSGSGSVPDPPKPIIPKYLRRAAPTAASTAATAGGGGGMVLSSGATGGPAGVLVTSASASTLASSTGPEIAGVDDGGSTSTGSTLAALTTPSWLSSRGSVRRGSMSGAIAGGAGGAGGSGAGMGADGGAGGGTLGVVIKLADLEMVEVARQLTLMEADMFRAISPMELVGLKWLQKDKDQAAPTLMRMTRWSNHVVQWVVSEIVSVRDVKSRAAMFERFIVLASELAKLNNFNGLKEVLAALASSAVHRLRKTKGLVPRKSLKLLDTLTSRVSPDLNHKSLRKELRTADPPLIPFPGLLQTDLVFVDTVTKTHMDNGMVHFTRCHKMAQHVLEWQEFQDQCWYNLEPVPEIMAYVRRYKVLDEEVAYAKSLAAEPRS
ncbi:ras guanine nucleotide exchange factor domain-containing protein [Catenaria anguillulae PL171]|uniref:Ras guanine nucleotide exchange factor domain-containing protein n=1 Tax=Catenaria anguillulae PL171 TaxID=765915 RepID=A0A1Y2HIM4_9FUNG|nr:ras guanine nucleotide exchange factor domain-containing protein [Catenaria anguillulae PL171]